MEDNKKIYSVLELNTFIKRLINSEYLLSNVYIKGEASNVKYHNATGHIYFTIKSRDDSGENSAISAVMFKGNASKLNFRLEEGMGIIVNGRVDVFEDVYKRQYIGYGKLTGTAGCKSVSCSPAADDAWNVI